MISSMLGFAPRRFRDSIDQYPYAFNIVYVHGPTCFRLIFFNDTSHYHRHAGGFSAMPSNRLSPYWFVLNPRESLS
jgi:hypothetical protein